MPSPASYPLSFIIPARNEYFHDLDLLSLTVENVLANTTQSSIVVVLDGYDNHWPLKPLPVDPRLTVIHHAKSIGQRAACNEGVRASTAKFICKLDAHCAIDKDFDIKMMAACDYETTLIAVQYNLEAFNWQCKKCRHRTYQGPKPPTCEKCGSRYLKIVPVWQPRGWKERNGVWEGRPKTTAWYFDTELHFQYAGDMQQRYVPDERGLTPTMTCLGACWMLHRDRYWELDGMDEQAGSWGQQGVELCLKSHLSGGQVMTNHNTWFAHLFRTQSGFGFPYPSPGVDKARARSRELWLENKWPKQKYPLSWLIDKFSPVRDWTTEGHPVTAKVKQAGDEFYRRQGQAIPYAPAIVRKPTACALYYTCNSHDETLELAARNNLRRATNGHELGCVALQRTDFGDWTVVLNREKSGTTMHYQILAGLERSRAEYVFLCESDVMYSPSHFEFVPSHNDTIYYNTNVWRVRYGDGHAVRTDNLQQVSGICANRELLLAHYRKRIEWIEANGGVFDSKRMAYEPGTRGKFGDEKIANWESPYPNLDVTGHGNTLTVPHFSVDSFRNKKYAVGWRETDEAIDGWPKVAGRVQEWLAELAGAVTQ
jgi:glycosyl transferase family 2